MPLPQIAVTFENPPTLDVAAVQRATVPSARSAIPVPETSTTCESQGGTPVPTTVPSDFKYEPHVMSTCWSRLLVYTSPPERVRIVPSLLKAAVASNPAAMATASVTAGAGKPLPHFTSDPSSFSATE